jgi:hypothetical protein
MLSAKVSSRRTSLVLNACSRSMCTNSTRPRTCSPVFSGTNTPDFSIRVPGTSVLPKRATVSTRFSLMSSVSPLRIKWAEMPISPSGVGATFRRWPPSVT